MKREFVVKGFFLIHYTRSLDNSNDSIPSILHSIEVRFEGERDLRRSIVAKKIGAVGKDIASTFSLGNVLLDLSRSKRPKKREPFLVFGTKLGDRENRDSSPIILQIYVPPRAQSTSCLVEIRSKRRFSSDKIPRRGKRNESKIDSSLLDFILPFHA